MRVTSWVISANSTFAWNLSLSPCVLNYTFSIRGWIILAQTKVSVVRLSFVNRNGITLVTRSIFFFFFEQILFSSSLEKYNEKTWYHEFSQTDIASIPGVHPSHSDIAQHNTLDVVGLRRVAKSSSCCTFWLFKRHNKLVWFSQIRFSRQQNH